MTDTLSSLRAACAAVASRARHVHIVGADVSEYARSLALEASIEPNPEAQLTHGDSETLAAFWLTLDAINFGSGWFPTLKKPSGRSGYFTIAAGIRERFATKGPWSAAELVGLDAGQVAAVLAQDPAHELMELFARSLSDLGGHVGREFDGSFTALVDSADGRAVTLVERLAGWKCFADSSTYDELDIPFLKRAQIAASDLNEARVASFADIERLTMFADNLVPHVLRLDGILSFDPELVERIERGTLLDHGSPEEVEIRACAVHAVEMIVAARPGSPASEIDKLLWNRGQGVPYKSRPRHRCRCTAY
jgi:hypothetical protein